MILLELLPDYPTLFWPAAATAVVLIGIAKAGFGGGAGVIGTPLMALTISVGDVVALLLPLLILCDFFSVWHYRANFHRRSTRLLLPGAAIGIGIGTFFFDQFLGNQQVMRGGIGALALLFAFYQLFRVRWLGRIEARHPHSVEGVLMGVVSGFTSTLAHAGGPPVAIFLLPQQLPRRAFVGTTVVVFAAINLLKVGPYFWLDLYYWGNLATVVVLAPLTFVGVRLGIWLNSRFNDVWFNRAVYVILVVTGMRLLSKALG